MEIQIRELIDQIKKDGVSAAEAEAVSIVDAAKAEAAKIVAEAKAQAEQILNNAKNENERIVKSGEDAIRQAGRNLLISFRESVTREMEAVLRENVNSAYSSEDFSQLILSVVEIWANNSEVENIAVVLNSNILKSVEDNLLAGLKARMLNGITLKASDSFDGGFRIAVNNGSAYYDYSSEAVVEMLSVYLSPRITELLKEA